MLPVLSALAGMRFPASKIARVVTKAAPAVSALAIAIKSWLPLFEKRPATATQQRANRAAAADMDWFQGFTGTAAGWSRTEYAEYYASSVSVYAAVRLRAEALSRPQLVVHRREPDGSLQPVGAGHSLQRLMDRVNPWYTRGDLWRATEIYLSLWGSAYWALEKDEQGGWEIWPLRPDRVNVIPDKKQYIRGFVYMGANGPVPYTAMRSYGCVTSIPWKSSPGYLLWRRSAWPWTWAKTHSGLTAIFSAIRPNPILSC